MTFLFGFIVLLTTLTVGTVVGRQFGTAKAIAAVCATLLGFGVLLFLFIAFALQGMD